MKKIIFCIIALFPLAGWAQSNYKLTINISKLNAPAKVYLFYRLSGETKKDSAVFVNGYASFSGSVANPLRADLVVDHTGGGMEKLSPVTADVFSLFLEKGDITLSATDSIKNGTVKGSAVSTEYLNYKKLIAEQVTAQHDIVLKHIANEKKPAPDTVLEKTLIALYHQKDAEMKVISTDYVKDHPDSYVSLALFDVVIGDSLDVKKVRPLFNNLSEKLKNSAAGQQYAKLIETASSIVVGAMAPDFSQKDTAGIMVKLSSFRGKYVLVDFWASWCVPCREENPNVVKAYTKYHAKGFDVLGVSLDEESTKKAWISAIHKDGLSWTQVSDLKSWKNEVAVLYGVRAIPQNVLIGPDGKIVGKNLRGADLTNKLAELFGAM